MTPRDLIAAFETLADAPDGVKRLRELVLQLAVRGKLLPNSFDNTSGSAKGWRKTDLGGVLLRLSNGLSDKQNKTGLGVTVTRIETIAEGVFDTDRVGFVDVSPSKAERYRLEAGDILLSHINSVPHLGKTALFSGGRELFHGTNLLLLRVDRVQCSPQFLHLTLRWLRVAGVFAAKAKHAIQQASINQSDLRSLPIAVPPLAEQHRIVARVDELMGLLDRLEAARTARDDLRRAARDSALAALRDAEDTEAVGAAWGRIAGEMDVLFADPEDVGPLRQAVLGLAVRGRLVGQDAKEEAARTHLHRLSGSTWKSATTDAGLPVLPPGWEWATAEQLASPESTITYGVLKPEWVERGVPTVRVRDLQDGEVRVNDVGQCDPARAEKFRKTTLKAGDLLIAKDGATLGKTAFVPPALAGGNITQHVLRFSIRDGLATRYVRLVVDSPHGQGWMLGETRGVALPGVNVGDFRRMPVPLPPLAEQHRIVAKVDALMSLCDALEARLTAARDLHAQFAAAAVHHLDV